MMIKKTWISSCFFSPGIPLSL